MLEVKTYISKDPRIYRKKIEELGIHCSTKNLEQYPEIFYYDLEKLKKGEHYYEKDLEEFIETAMYIKYDNQILIGLGVKGLELLETVMHSLVMFFQNDFHSVKSQLGIDYDEISINNCGEDAEIFVYEEPTNKIFYQGSAPKKLLLNGVLNSASDYYKTLWELKKMNDHEYERLMIKINEYRKLYR
ncbi:hypothetical protein [Chengkuizengella marina]|uniref:Uncharacterized protein n=1 Tax=Chengkuizengella marina TaxID=2507566 RepID=A0A6N9Q031_9BACL|nr:hypothetical protein [Chengkuizengella marina]NBI28506.1 hypothetical protein [Chengkuizengella marina]